MLTTERQLQQCLNNLEVRASRNGFKFAKAKAECVHFCNSRQPHDDPVLHLYNVPINVVAQVGVIFLSKLIFILHIDCLI